MFFWTEPTSCRVGDVVSQIFIKQRASLYPLFCLPLTVYPSLSLSSHFLPSLLFIFFLNSPPLSFTVPHCPDVCGSFPPLLSTSLFLSLPPAFTSSDLLYSILLSPSLLSRSFPPSLPHDLCLSLPHSSPPSLPLSSLSAACLLHVCVCDCVFPLTDRERC